VSQQAAGSRNNYAFSFTGVTGGAANLGFRDCIFEGWGRVFDTTTNTSNQDSHTHYDCVFRNNDAVWYNSNLQALMWNFVDCMFHFNELVFYDPATYLYVENADCINPGDFYVTNGLNSLGGKAFFTGCRFEVYQNIDATKSPTFLKITGGTTDAIVFENCGNSAGGNYTGKTAFDLAGVFEVTMRGCDWQGDCKILANGATSRILSTLKFQDCDSTPAIVQTLNAGTGNNPINLIYENSRPPSAGAFTKRVNRSFVGLLPNPDFPQVIKPVHEAFWMQHVVSNSSAGNQVSLYVPDIYDLAIFGAIITIDHNTSNAFDLILWQDNTKIAKVFELTGIGTTGSLEVFEVSAGDLLSRPRITDTSNPLYLEVTSALNAGTVNVQCTLNLIHAVRAI
jgi:hypothetical protein